MRGRPRFTTRAGIVGVVLVVLGLTLVYPLRLYTAQRGQIKQLAAQNEAQRKRVEALQQTVKAYDNPEWVRDQARLRLHYTAPGERVYVVTPAPAPRPTVSPTGRPSPGRSVVPSPRPSPHPTRTAAAIAPGAAPGTASGSPTARHR